MLGDLEVAALALALAVTLGDMEAAALALGLAVWLGALLGVPKALAEPEEEGSEV